MAGRSYRVARRGGNAFHCASPAGRKVLEELGAAYTELGRPRDRRHLRHDLAGTILCDGADDVLQRVVVGVAERLDDQRLQVRLAVDGAHPGAQRLDAQRSVVLPERDVEQLLQGGVRLPQELGELAARR